MSLRLLRTVLLFYVATIWFANATVPAEIVGSILIECGRPVLHSVLEGSDAGILIPVDYGRQQQIIEHGFVPDSNTSCLEGHAEILNYCRKLYHANLTNQLEIKHTIVAPFAIPLHHWPGVVGNVSESRTIWIRPYWCIATNQSFEWDSIQNSSSSPGNHIKLPSLIDLHKAIFVDKFHQLKEQTNETISSYLQTMLTEAKGLGELNRTYPKLAHYLGSNMFQRAHDQLNAIWLNEETQWSYLEISEHFDLMQQLTQEEIEGENEFLYTLQEPEPNNDRVQSALSRLLSGLTNLVNEQLRHLKTVSTNQPWLLTLNRTYSSDWTTNLHHHVINIYQVHASLLSYVRRATVAINKFHTFIGQYLNQSSSVHVISYEPALVANYQTLKQSLANAKHTLERTKHNLLTYLNQHQTHFVTNNHRENYTINQNKIFSAKLLPSLVQEKHQTDLSKFDAVLLGLYHSNVIEQTSITRNEIKKGNSHVNKISDLWLPHEKSHTTTTRPRTAQTTELDVTMCSIITFLVILKTLVIALSLLGIVVIICRVYRLIHASNATQQTEQTVYQFQQLFWTHTHKMKFWLTRRFGARQFPTSRKTYVEPYVGVKLPPSSVPLSVASDNQPTLVDRSNTTSTGPVLVQGYVNPLDSISHA